jgi:SagB-type dehydrogenase family enzyme
MLENKVLVDAANADEQLRLPTNPRLSEDFLKLWHNQQTLVVLGAADEVVLRGKAVGALLPQLLPQLNGRLSVEEIGARIPGLKPATLNETLLLLYMNGLLEEGLVQSTNLSRESVRAFDEQLKYYSRYVDFTRSCHNRFEVLGRLQDSSVLIVGRGRGARQLLRELASLGLGRALLLPLDGGSPGWHALGLGPHTSVETLDVVAEAVEAGDEEALASLGGRFEGQRLILLVTDEPAHGLTRSLNRLAVERGVAFMRCRFSPEAVEVGHLYLPGESGCYECSHRSQVLDLDGQGEAATATAAGDEWLTPEEQFGASHAALLLLSHLSGLTPAVSEFSFFRFDPAKFEFVRHAVYQLPGCPVCSRLSGYEAGRDLLFGESHMENWPALYHFNTNDRQSTVIPKGHQRHYSPKVLKLMEGAYKTYAGGTQADLTPTATRWPEPLSQPYAGVAEGATRTPPRRRVSVEDISWLLQIAAGRRLGDPKVGWPPGQRFTPSGGGLASQQLYLANLSVEGLEPGLYHFNQVQGLLEKMPGEGLEEQLRRAVPGTEELSGRVAAAIIQTAAFGRLEYKYIFKAYRYSMFDSGAMLQSLYTVSQVLGLEFWHSSHFYDDEVSALLGLHTVTEFPTYVAYLAEPGGSPAADGEGE